MISGCSSLHTEIKKKGLLLATSLQAKDRAAEGHQDMYLLLCDSFSHQTFSLLTQYFPASMKVQDRLFKVRQPGGGAKL